MNRELNIINRAIDEFEYELVRNKTFEEIFEECEDVLLSSVDYDDMEECELVCNRNQWYSFADKWGFQKDCSGEIFDFSSKSPDTYFKIENNEFKEFVEWFDIPYDGAERHEFGFVFDRVINSEGKVIALWDRLK